MADSEKKPKDIPVSVWNNNEGNLRPPKGKDGKPIVYQGQIGVDPRGFAIFETPEDGHRALINDINIKIKRGINTPDAFIDLYAPAGKENSEETRKNYKEKIRKALEINGNSDLFPEDPAEKISSVIKGFEAGTWEDSKDKSDKANVNAEAPAMPTEPPPSTIELDIHGKPIDTSQANKDQNPNENEGRVVSSGNTEEGGGNAASNTTSDAAKMVLGAAGTKAGLVTAGTIEAAKLGLPVLPNAYRALRGTPINFDAPSTRSSMQRYLNSQHHHKVHLSDLEKAFNEHLKLSNPGADPRRLRTMSEVQEALAAIKKTPDQIVAKPRVEMVPGKPGVFRNTGEFNSKLIPGNPGIDLSKYAPNPNTPIRNVVTNAGKSIADFTKGVTPSLSRVALGGLGGLSGTLSAIDAADYYNTHEDPLLDPRFYSKVASGVGGGLMMLPVKSPWTQGIGMALSAPEMGIQAYEAYKDKKGKQFSRTTLRGVFSPLSVTFSGQGFFYIVIIKISVIQIINQIASVILCLAPL